MLNFSDLEQLVAFADCGTLSHAAEALHISQPTITRTMQRLEEDFGAPLFDRGRNRIALNATGECAVEHARKLLFDAEQAVRAVQAFDRSQHEISVASCAPAPLWSLLPQLSARFPENTISSRVMDTPDVLAGFSAGEYTLAILPEPCAGDALCDVPFLREVLSVCVPLTHPLADAEQLSFSELNGYNCLLRDELGFWTRLVKEEMPASRFLVQTDAFEFTELVRHSTLLSFVTNLALAENRVLADHRIIPLSDPAADVTYHLICRPEHRALIAPFAR